MTTFTVACFNKTTGKIVWSMTQEASTAIQAIAQATLPETTNARMHLVVDNFETNPFETTIDHPAQDMAQFFSVHAECPR
jgi:hypothetical protein